MLVKPANVSDREWGQLTRFAFTAELRANAANDGDRVELVDLRRLYRGD